MEQKHELKVIIGIFKDGKLTSRFTSQKEVSCMQDAGDIINDLLNQSHIRSFIEINSMSPEEIEKALEGIPPEELPF